MLQLIYKFSKTTHPGSIIYDDISIKDSNLEQNGLLNVFCDTTNTENPDVFNKIWYSYNDLINSIII